jgi:hypothetical protein
MRVAAVERLVIVKRVSRHAGLQSVIAPSHARRCYLISTEGIVMEFYIAGEYGPCGARKGRLITMKVGDEDVKFVIQQPEDYLTHYATGWALRTYGPRITSKAKAQKLLNEIIEEYGVEEVLRRLNSNEVINK